MLVQGQSKAATISSSTRCGGFGVTERGEYDLLDTCVGELPDSIYDVISRPCHGPGAEGFDEAPSGFFVVREVQRHMNRAPDLGRIATDLFRSASPTRRACADNFQ